MNPNQLLTRYGKHSERIMFPQILLRSERKFCQMLQMLQIIRMHTRAVEAFPIMRNIIVGVA